MVSGLPIISAWLISKYLPESPRWLVRRGQESRALEVLAIVEAETIKRSGASLPEPTSEPVAAQELSMPIRARFWMPWQRPYVRRTIVSGVAATGTFFIFYIVMTYLPLIFGQDGLTLAKSLVFAAIIIGAGIPGKLVNGWLGELWGRKAMYIIFMGIAGVGALFFGGAKTALFMIGYGCVMSFFGNGAFPSLKMSYSEQYPTPLRTTGSATVEMWGRFLGGVVGSFAFPSLIAGIGVIPSFRIVAVVCFVAVIILGGFSQETKNQSLESIEMNLSHHGL